jgi:hypothetical protein
MFSDFVMTISLFRQGPDAANTLTTTPAAGWIDQKNFVTLFSHVSGK